MTPKYWHCYLGANLRPVRTIVFPWDVQSEGPGVALWQLVPALYIPEKPPLGSVGMSSMCHSAQQPITHVMTLESITQIIITGVTGQIL